MTTNHSSWDWTLQGTDDPSATPTPAPIGTQYRRTDTGTIYQKTGSGDTDWTLLVLAPATVVTDGRSLVGNGTVALPISRYLAKIARLESDFTDGSKFHFSADGIATAAVVALDTHPGGDAIGIVEMSLTQAGDAVEIDITDGLYAIDGTSLDPNQMMLCECRLQYNGNNPPQAGEDVFIQVGMTIDLTTNMAYGGYPMFQAGFAQFGNGNWWATVGGTQVDTGIPLSTGTAYQRLSITTDQTGAGNALFYIDGVLVATIAQNNAPQGSPVVKFQFVDIVGGVTMWVDYIEVDVVGVR